MTSCFDKSNPDNFWSLAIAMHPMWVLVGIMWTVWLLQICFVVGLQVSERIQKTSVEYTTSIIQNGKWV